MVQNRFPTEEPPLAKTSNEEFWHWVRTEGARLQAELGLNMCIGEFWKHEYGPIRHYPITEELNAWAKFHKIPEDLALLLCANVAAHLAGPHLEFCNRSLSGPQKILTVVGLEEDAGLRHAIDAAMESLLAIEQGFVEQAEKGTEAGRDAGLDDSEWVAWTLNEERRLKGQGSSDGGSAETSDASVGPSVPSGNHFVLQGGIPAKPQQILPGYHKCMAYAPGVIERLPDATNARDARVDLLNQVVSGVFVPSKEDEDVDEKTRLIRSLGEIPSRRGTHGLIRGILLFRHEDLEWLLKNKLSFLILTLPTGSLEEERVGEGLEDGMPAVGSEQLATAAKSFDYARRRVLRNSLNARLNNSFCPSRFYEKEAEDGYVKELEVYREEIRGCSHVLPALENLPALLVWYLLQFEHYRSALTQELAIVRHAFAMARKLRQRAMALYNDCEAANQARARLELATKLVARLRRLGRPSTRWELARGLDDQRKEVVAPVIDRLLVNGVFTEDSGRLSLGSEGSGRELRLENFMEPDRAKGEPVANSWLWPGIRLEKPATPEPSNTF